MTTKILIFGQLPPPYHGSNIMTEIFINSLKKMDCKVFIAEKNFSNTMGEMGKYPLKKFVRALLIIIKLAWTLMTTRAELCFYFISLKPPSIYMDLLFIHLLRIINTKTVLYVHGRGFRKLFRKSALMRLFLRSAVVSSLNGAIVLCERLIKDIEFFIPHNRIFILPNSIPDADLESLSRSKIKRKSNEIGILYLSNLFPAKGTIEFLKMAKIVVDNKTPVKFFLAGAATSESFQKRIVRIISDLKLNNDVKITGAVYGSEKERLFFESDIFVFPTYREAMPLVNLEAMRAGLPIVSSNEGCIPGMVIDGFNGFIVDPHNIEQISKQVLELVNNENLRVKMGHAGRKMFEENFTTQVYEKRLKEGLDFFLNIQVND